jgi:Protein of unknown function (DUF3572)
MKQERARAIGQEALIWLAGDPEAFGTFLDSSGMPAASVRDGAEDPAFLGFVLDFVLASDASVLAFAEAAGLRPEEPGLARVVLGGEPHWT